jgi:lysophospholipase L1-like esterase
MSMFVKRMVKLGLVLVSMVLMLSFIEIMLRVTGYRRKESTWKFVTDNKYEFILDKDKIYRREKDFRSNTSISGGVPGKKILFVGDSMTWGHSVEDNETYPYLVQRSIGETLENVETMNAGVEGYGIDQEYLLIKDQVLRYSPDIIVWNINPVNDIEDANEACLFKMVGGNYVKIPAWENTLFWQGVIRRDLENAGIFPNVSNLASSLLGSYKGYTRFTFGCTSADFEVAKTEALKKLKYFVDEIDKETKDKGIKLIVTLVPYQAYFDKTIKNEELSKYFDFKSILAQSGVDFLDMNESIGSSVDSQLVAIRNGSDDVNMTILGRTTIDYSKELFFSDDGFRYGGRHTNTEGYKLMARVVKDYILKLQ